MFLAILMTFSSIITTNTQCGKIKVNTKKMLTPVYLGEQIEGLENEFQIKNSEIISNLDLDLEEGTYGIKINWEACKRSLKKGTVFFITPNTEPQPEHLIEVKLHNGQHFLAEFKSKSDEFLEYSTLTTDELNSLPISDVLSVSNVTLILSASHYKEISESQSI